MKELTAEETVGVLERARARHGGDAAYARLGRLGFDIESLGGLVPRWRGLGGTFRVPRRVEVEPHARRTTFVDYPAVGEQLVFDRGAIVHRRGGEEEYVTPSPELRFRRRFDGWGRVRLWRPADAAYFFGYALADYHSLPFALDPGRVERGFSDRGVDEVWVRWPAEVDTHSSLQAYRFDASGLLVRHDYRAEIMGRVFNGAHVATDWREVRGVLVARRRVVWAKVGHLPCRKRIPFPVLKAVLGRIE